MKNGGVVSTVVIALLAAAIWGYFADLRSGEVGWFVGRLIFCGAAAFAGVKLRQRSQS